MTTCKIHPEYKPAEKKPSTGCLPCLYMWNVDQIYQGKVSFENNFFVQESIREEKINIARRSIFANKKKK